MRGHPQDRGGREHLLSGRLGVLTGEGGSQVLMEVWGYRGTLGRETLGGSGSLSEGKRLQTELKPGSGSPVLSTGPQSTGAWTWVSAGSSDSPGRRMGSHLPVL